MSALLSFSPFQTNAICAPSGEKVGIVSLPESEVICTNRGGGPAERVSAHQSPMPAIPAAVNTAMAVQSTREEIPPPDAAIGLVAGLGSIGSITGGHSTDAGDTGVGIPSTGAIKQ